MLSRYDEASASSLPVNVLLWKGILATANGECALRWLGGTKKKTNKVFTAGTRASAKGVGSRVRNRLDSFSGRAPALKLSLVVPQFIL